MLCRISTIPLRAVCSLMLALCVVSAFGAETSTTSALKAGAAKRSIVPPFPTRMGGFYDRLANFTGVKSPVYARALVCDNGTTSIAVVTTDLIQVSWNLVEACRAEITAQTKIPSDHVLICAAHNHSAPTGFQKYSAYGAAFDKGLFDFLRQEIVAAVVEAHGRLRPAQIGFASGRLDAITRNRQQDNTTVIDPEVGVLKVQEEDSRNLIAVLFNFTGHPVILGSDNLEVCGEYPGMAAQTVEDVLGGVALFTQGACGDVTMLRSGPPFLEVQRLGRVLAAEVIETCEMTATKPDATLASVYKPVQVNSRDLPSVKKASETLKAARKAVVDGKSAGISQRELRQLERVADSAEWTLNLTKFAHAHCEAYRAARNASIHVVRIGPLILVGIPGELFVEYGLEIKQRIRLTTGHPAIIAGYANDYIGYIVTPRAIHTGGYEQAVARVDENAGRALVDTAVRIIERLVQ
ncbi:MAG: neutral/alkaline non-lysosomal ceramidase N-terminal domain-containing protein [Candidatus Hydrogenedentes bacterium]|nr:neutral/alkaline non-lysosomal ceramidase N-terminal domain-containing protein [Candidatus Hydrogenedentota bacterium]